MIFLTGATGFLGTQLLTDLLSNHKKNIIVLVRAKNKNLAYKKVTEALLPSFEQKAIDVFFENKLIIISGDLSLPKFGLSNDEWQFLLDNITSIIHSAAAVNRLNWDICYQHNVQSTINIIELIKEIEKNRKLDKFTFISTATVAPIKRNACYVEEPPVANKDSLEDSYVKSKIQSELLILNQLKNTEKIIIRPSLIVGNSVTNESTQYYVLKFFHQISKWLILPIKGKWVIDTIPVDYVSKATLCLHFKSNTKHIIYHASSYQDSITYKELHQICSNDSSALFLPFLAPILNILFNFFSLLPKKWQIARMSKLWIVFYPYMISSMQYDNTRIIEELGFKPVPLRDYLKNQMNRAILKNFKN